MVGQRSLMPGQCPGLPGFGYATVYHVACVVAFIKYYAHTNGATKFCNGLLECGSW